VVVRQAFTAETAATPQDLFAVVSDLGTYPHWLDVVDAAEEVPDTPETWVVTLKARVGPFARSKRLRMVRTELTETSVRFDRQELDGKDHSRWTLEAAVGDAPAPQGTGSGGGRGDGGAGMASEVQLSLEYDGAMWSGLLDGVLNAAADRATKKLQAYVAP